MKWQFLLLCLIGIVAAVCAAVLVTVLRAPVGAPQAEHLAPEEVAIAVAAGPLKPMTTIEASAVVMKKVAGIQAPHSYFGDSVQVIGQVLVTPMVEGQAFTKANFAPEGPGVHLAATLAPGMRAMSVSLSDYSGLDGLLYPGAAVDVLASFDMRSKGAGEGGVMSETLLRGVQVLAIEDRTVVSPQKDEEKPANRVAERRRRVTLMVDSIQAEQLQLAMEHGTISLVMRNPRDPMERGGEHITRLVELGPPAPEPPPVKPPEPAKPSADDLAKAEAAKPKAPEPVKEPPKRSVVLLRGGESSTLWFPLPEAPAVPRVLGGGPK